MLVYAKRTHMFKKVNISYDFVDATERFKSLTFDGASKVPSHDRFHRSTPSDIYYLKMITLVNDTK